MNGNSTRLWAEETCDAELILGVREGDNEALGLLYLRHGGAARRVASMYSPRPSDIDDIVSESFEKVFAALRNGAGPTETFRSYLFTVVRRVGLVMIRADRRVQACEDMTVHDNEAGYAESGSEAAMAGFERSTAVDAFRTLPERWQRVIWYLEVEKKKPADIAGEFGLSPNGVAALAHRAREALREAYLHQHLADVETTGCLDAFDDLAGYVRGTLAKRAHAKVTKHLDDCERCRRLTDELEDANGLLG